MLYWVDSWYKRYFMFNKSIFIIAHQVGDRRFYPTYKKLLQNQWNSYSELEVEQEKQLQKMISFAYAYVPYYHNLFNSLKLCPQDIRSIEDLEKLPVLTKDILQEHWRDFQPTNLNKINYYDWSTGGSTGSPFKFRLEKFDRFLSGAMLYRGWSYGGFEPGDKMAFLAGSSLGIGVMSKLKSKIHEFARNIRMLSSFDMDTNDMRGYSEIINSFKPKFIYGYASSIYFFSKYLEENDIQIHSPIAIFTTAEKLFPYMRSQIKNVFCSDVYNIYGLNDGGVTAYECEEHSGLHINTERSIMEVVDENGTQLKNGLGKIVATSLYNYAIPFIRYDTKDLGQITEDECSCGRDYKLLKEVVGRQQEMLMTPEGKYIHGEFFTHIFWEIDGVKEFQVIQNKLDVLTIKIVPDINFDESQLIKIRDIINKRSNSWSIDFKFVDSIERTHAGKYKFVISNLKSF